MILCNAFSVEDKTWSDHVAAGGNFQWGSSDYEDCGMGGWLMTAIENLSYLIKAQSGNQRAYTTELKEFLRYRGGMANV